MDFTTWEKLHAYKGEGILSMISFSTYKITFFRSPKLHLCGESFMRKFNLFEPLIKLLNSVINRNSRVSIAWLERRGVG